MHDQIFTYDPEADAAYLQLTNRAIIGTEALDEQRLIDRDAQGQPVGIELLNVRAGSALSGLPAAAALAGFLAAAGLPVTD